MNAQYLPLAQPTFLTVLFAIENEFYLFSRLQLSEEVRSYVGKRVPLNTKREIKTALKSFGKFVIDRP